MTVESRGSTPVSKGSIEHESKNYPRISYIKRYAAP